MESTNTTPSKDVERICQVEGCKEFTVGGRATLCRKHRNNKYKQNYKKKKRKAAGIEESQYNHPEIQQSEEKLFLEQRYANMLEQVIISKRLELLQSENVIQILKKHQWKVKEMKLKEMEEKKKLIESEERQQQQSKQKLQPQKLQLQQQQQLSKIPKSASLTPKLVCNNSTPTDSQKTSSAQAKHAKKLNSTASVKKSRPKIAPTSVTCVTNTNESSSTAVTATLAVSSSVHQSLPIQTNYSSLAPDILTTPNSTISCMGGSSTSANLLTASCNRQMPFVSTKNIPDCYLNQSPTDIRKNFSTSCHIGANSFLPVAMVTSVTNTMKANRSNDASMASKTSAVVTSNQMAGRFQAIAPATMSSPFPVTAMATRPQAVTPVSTNKIRPIQGTPLTHIAPNIPLEAWASGLSAAHSELSKSAPTQQKLLNSSRQEMPRTLTDFAVAQKISSCHVVQRSSSLNVNIRPASFAQNPEMQQMRTSTFNGSNFSQTGQDSRQGEIGMDSPELSTLRGKMKGTTAHAVEQMMAEAQWAMNIDI